MNLLSGTATKTFNLLSIGQRGVGKTVFLAGSYTELHADSQTERSGQLWFDCQDSNVQEKIESILSYVVQTGQYPPPTMKVTDFSFSLKRNSLWGAQTLSHFRWWDIPGEICNIDNRDFRSMVSTSHGCCVFIDSYALVYNNAYIQALEDIIEQVTAVTSLVSLNVLKYSFALIFTKYDLLDPGPLSRHQLAKGLQPLTSRLDALRANYQTFYSLIPIVRAQGASTLRPIGAAAPLLWLVWELSLAHNPGLTNNLLELVTRARPIGFRLHNQFRPDDTVGVKMAIAGFMLASGLLWVNYEWAFQRQPNNLDTLENIATLRRRGQFDQAISLMEILVEQEPERLDLRLHLADLYEITGQVSRAETGYDQVLARQKNNLKALVGKAVLRKVQGDTKTASVLFAQAEKAAPTDLKVQIRALAQKTLHPAR